MRFIALVALLLIAACDQPDPEVHSKPVPVPASAPDVGWTLHGNDTGEQRYSSLDQINQGNVSELGLAWSFDLYTRRGVEATPLVVDGLMYVTSSWSMVYALDAKTGELKWFYNPEVDRSFLAKGCCDAVNRGVAYLDGTVYLATYDGFLVALDALTGKEIWKTLTIDQTRPYTITGAPRIAGNKIVIGNGGAEMGVRGYVSAYDATSGEMAWRFYTVPGNPEEGFENDAMEHAASTWTGEWWKWGGGGTVWDSMVYDPELDLLYIGVGNGSPWNQSMRSPDGGDNLFLTAIVALQPDTGEYVWHYQTTPGETWDYTATQHMILADIEIGGRLRKVLMQAPKNGFFYVIDRTNGDLISAEPYVEVNWASEINLETGRPVETPQARVFNGENISLPSNAGGHNWPPMSYSPDTGLVYIPTMVFPVAFLQPTEEKDSKPGQGYWNVGFDRMGGSPPKIPDLGEVLAQQFTGKLVAWDPVNQSASWATAVGRPSVGGVLSTAGGLVFHGGQDNVFNAYKAATGERLWNADPQSGAMVPMTYAIDGEQYIAVSVGMTGGFLSEGGPVAHDWKEPNLPRILVYKLGGDKTLPEVIADTRVMPEPAPATGSTDLVTRGEVVYQRHCAYCHGDGLRTGGASPDLRWSSAQTHNMWLDIVRGGILEKRGMVSFAQFVSEDDAEAIRQFVLSEANRHYQYAHPEWKPGKTK